MLFVLCALLFYVIRMLQIKHDSDNRTEEVIVWMCCRVSKVSNISRCPTVFSWRIWYVSWIVFLNKYQTYIMEKIYFITFLFLTFFMFPKDLIDIWNSIYFHATFGVSDTGDDLPVRSWHHAASNTSRSGRSRRTGQAAIDPRHKVTDGFGDGFYDTYIYI